MKLLFEYCKTDVFDINKNGIQLIECNNVIEIYNDPFRTIPLFITSDLSGQLIIFSKFDDFYNFEYADKSIDLVGFWEIVLFGSGLWTRTLYKNVQQMPAATCLSINKSSLQYSFKRYWDFDVEEDSSIHTLEQAVDGLYSILDRIFSSLDKSKAYLMGMSGGLDSRITLAFLSKHIPRENINLFTYGFDENILEFKYAKEIARCLKVPAPFFHELKSSSYRDALIYLPSMSGGQISINHCHIFDYLKKNKQDNLQHISTYFSDAVFGWDCIYPKRLTNPLYNYYAEVARSTAHLSQEIKKSIIDDSLNIFACFNANANLSSLDEFKYITERNPKFHMFMASLQGQLSDMEPIYANIDLLKYCLGVPIKFRQNKNMIDVLLHKYFKNISSGDFKNISSRFQWGKKYAGFFDWYFFLLLNRISSILRVLTNGGVQLHNKYQTEEHERLLYGEFRMDLKLATSKLLTLGILSKEQKLEFDSLPIRGAGVAERYAIISLAKIL